MKEKLLDLLACPSCGGDILLAYASKYLDKEILEAVLTCRKCDREYSVTRGIPRFAALDKIEQDKADTARKFRLAMDAFHAGRHEIRRTISRLAAAGRTGIF